MSLEKISFENCVPGCLNVSKKWLNRLLNRRNFAYFNSFFFNNSFNLNSAAVLYSHNNLRKKEAVLCNEPVGWQKEQLFTE